MADDQDEDGRHAMARGYVLASRVMSIGMQMVVPLGVGWWVDSVWKTAPWCMSLGAVLGFVVAMLELIHLAKVSAASEDERASRGGNLNTVDVKLDPGERPGVGGQGGGS